MKTRPKYLSIADEIHARILGGEFAGAGKLPTQKELAQEYGVAVLTIKQALSELQNEGLISGVRGSGTFISSEAFRYQIKFLSSFADEVSSQHRELTTELLQVVSVKEPDLEVTAQLGIPADTPYVCIWRLRSIDGVPLILQRSFITDELFNKFDQAQLREKSLYSMLTQSAGITISRASETIRAIALPEYAAEHLGQPSGSVALFSVRVTKDESDKPVVLDYAYFPGDSAVIESERFVRRGSHE
ncbi:unannotated protein [freshwater metagenome]|uniref:Unannotated protein n=1 Tax=freshwater metagenome TaxID=449393 RepID=A0A6J7VC38_9ZZZZ|nr:UTRA domain-containing protein [Actinomycetota bacterium]